MKKVLSSKVFEQKPHMRTFFTELKRAVWILRKKSKVNRTSSLVKSIYKNVYASSNEEWENEMQIKRDEVIFGKNLLTVDGLWLTEFYTQKINEWIQKLEGKKYWKSVLEEEVYYLDFSNLIPSFN